MAFSSKDGSKFTNRDTMQQHERSMASRAPKIGSEQALEEPDGGHDEPMGEDPHGVVQQHGPAVEVNVMHDHQGGKHSVHSMHQDGHEHESEHGSAKEAGQHGMCLGGDCDCGGM